MVQLSLNISEKDYLHYAEMNLRRWKKYNWSFLLVILTTIWALSMIIFSLVTNQPVNSSVTLIILLLAVIYFSMRILFTYRNKKEYRSNPLLQQKITYTLDSKGLSTETKATKSYIKWEQVIKVRQSKKILAIYISANQAYIFNKEHLSEEVKKELFHLFKNHLPVMKFYYTHL